MIKKTLFDTMKDGREVFAYTLTNKFSASATILNYGAIVQSMIIPDRENKLKDVVCGFTTVEDYINAGAYFGSIVGRYSNRITGGHFVLNGVEYNVGLNDNHHSLHGGFYGFNTKIWDVQCIERDDGDQLIMHCVSPDGEEGYPGKLDVTVSYTFTDNNVLRIEYTAFSDKDTIVSMTNHSYFNLAGYGSCDIKEHRLYINSDKALAANEEDLGITGEFIDVNNSKYDFRRFTPMEEYIDNSYVLKNNGKFEQVAEVRECNEGRALEVWTDCPILQYYSSNMMNGKVNFKGGVPEKPHTAFCLESQLYPDAINHDNFPSPVLKAGDTYHNITEYRFKTV